jgi:hypothetical protein
MGDILGLLIESNYVQGEFEKARGILGQLKGRLGKGFSVEYYVDSEILKAIMSKDEPADSEEFIEEYIN